MLLKKAIVSFKFVQSTIHKLVVAYWIKHWTVDRKAQGSSPTCSRDFFWVHSALPQKLSRRFSFASFGGDAVSLGEPLKISLSAIGNFLVNWVIPGKPYKYRSAMVDISEQSSS